MLANDLVIDAFERIKQVVHSVVKDLSDDQLTIRIEDSVNSIAWLVWHLSRIQDDHTAGLSGDKQVWSEGWSDKFNLPFDESDTGWGHDKNQVAAVKTSAELLLGYFDAVHKRTLSYVKNLKQEDYARIVDRNWNPPVTVAVRVISVISDDLQHAGQAAYVRGLITKN